MADVCLLPATEQALLVRPGTLSASELVSAHLARIERINPAVNAIVTVVAERALAAAGEADRRRASGGPLPPLHGLPIAHKDLVDTAGVRTTYGSPSYRDHVPEADMLLATRLREAGAILVGKTNTPEWGAGSNTFNPVFGATRNPWDTARSAGGSSGGAAVALACRLVPLADGSDLGGSLRNPAAWNGVVGLRPTPGVVPSWPSDAPWLPFSVDGPIGRNAGDVALLLAAMAGPDPRAPLSQRAARLDLDGPLDADLRGRRVAWSRSLGGLPLEPPVLAAVEGAVARLADLGLDVVDDEPDLAGADRVFETWRAFMFALSLGELYDRDGARMKATVRWNVERGRALSSSDLVAATRLHAELCERVARLLRALRLSGLPGHPGRALRGRDRVPDRGRRRADGLLPGVDAILLAHYRHGLPGDLDSGRAHGGRSARRPAAGRPAVRRARPARGRARIRWAHGVFRARAAGCGGRSVNPPRVSGPVQ